MNREASDTISDMTELITSITKTLKRLWHNISLLFFKPAVVTASTV